MPAIEASLHWGRPVPLIDIDLSLGGSALRVRALVDSGAITTLLPSVGHSRFLLRGSPGQGARAGGILLTRILEASVSWDGIPFAQRIHIVEPRRLPFAVVGREDFFRRFVVRFDWTRVRPIMDIDPA